MISITTNNKIFQAKDIIVATGGCGYPSLGGSINSFNFLKNIGHTITPLYPAMIPLQTKEDWVSNCRADTIPKATIKIDIKKYSKQKAFGDLIFTKNGIRGPVVLDFSKYITPLLDKYLQVPILINLTQGKNENEIHTILNNRFNNNHEESIINTLSSIIPLSLAKVMCKLNNILPNEKFNTISGDKKNSLLKYLAWTPLTITGSDGFEKAMVTNGGINLKQINPKTMRSKLFDNLYFAGEVINLDGPCGGFNLQIAFSTGVLAAQSI